MAALESIMILHLYGYGLISTKTEIIGKLFEF